MYISHVCECLDLPVALRNISHYSVANNTNNSLKDQLNMDSAISAVGAGRNLELCNHSEGSSRRGGCSPVCVAMIFSLVKEILLPVVVWFLKEDPCSIHHHTRMELAELECLKN